MRDASLDEFASGGEDDDGEGTDEESVVDTDGDHEVDTDGDGAGEDGGDGVADPGSPGDRTESTDGEDSEGDPDGEPTLTVEPATPTYDWSPEGAACAACGSVVEARWQAEGVGLVCPDCKEW